MYPIDRSFPHSQSARPPLPSMDGPIGVNYWDDFPPLEPSFERSFNRLLSASPVDSGSFGFEHTEQPSLATPWSPSTACESSPSHESISHTSKSTSPQPPPFGVIGRPRTLSSASATVGTLPTPSELATRPPRVHHHSECILPSTGLFPSHASASRGGFSAGIDPDFLVRLCNTHPDFQQTLKGDASPIPTYVEACGTPPQRSPSLASITMGSDRGYGSLHGVSPPAPMPPYSRPSIQQHQQKRLDQEQYSQPPSISHVKPLMSCQMQFPPAGLESLGGRGGGGRSQAAQGGFGAWPNNNYQMSPAAGYYSPQSNHHGARANSQGGFRNGGGGGGGDAGFQNVMQPPASAPRQEHRSEGEGPSQLRKLFVGGIATTISKDDFTSYFAQFGALVDAVIMHDNNGAPRGFGFVTYRTLASAEDALNAIPHEICGKRVDTKRAIPKSQMTGASGWSEAEGGGSLDGAGCTIIVRGIEYSFGSVEALREHFAAFGEVQDISISADGAVGTVRFTTSDAAKIAIAYANGEHVIGGRMATVRFATPPPSINGQHGSADWSE